MRLLLLSNSSLPEQAYLEFAMGEVGNFLLSINTEALFIPYAAVTFSYDLYEEKVNKAFNAIGHKVKSIHHFSDQVEAVRHAKVVIVGGGNTFKLVCELRRNNLLQAIRERVLAGVPYIGWSAGANIASPSLRTTNDMPVIDPMGFDTLNLVSFQINPHYTDFNPPGHAGETREQRIEEFIELNRDTYVVALREGTMLLCNNNTLELKGEKPARIFKYSSDPYELQPGSDFSFLV
jgi:dipeptidase E